MKYRYKRFQIGKPLKVPKNIQENIFNNCILFRDVLKYHLEDKIPLSCVLYADRIIIEKFGIEVCRELDWELLSSYDGHTARAVLESLNPSDDVVKEFYDRMSRLIAPVNFTPRMRERCGRRFCEINTSDRTEDIRLKTQFNDGKLTMQDIVEHWELFKDKDLDYCLERDTYNELNIRTEELKRFMDFFKTVGVAIYYSNINFYQIVRKFNTITDEQEREEYAKELTDGVLKYIQKSVKLDFDVKLSKEDYDFIFKYHSLEDYIRLVGKDVYEESLENFIREVKSLPPDYLYTQHIPFNILCSFESIRLMGTYGIKTIVDFDRDNNNVLSKERCRLLLKMYDAYVKYGYSFDEAYTLRFDIKDRPYTEEEFNEVVRRMIIRRETTSSDLKNYRIDPTSLGKFRERNKDLYIADDAPEELKEKYYRGKLTPADLYEHRDYIGYLEGHTGMIFSSRIVYISNGDPLDIGDLYSFLFEKGSYEEIMNFIADYSDLLEIVYTHDNSRMRFNRSDNLGEIKEKIINRYKEILIQFRLPYSSKLPEDVIISHKELFLPIDAPEELKKDLFLRKIDIDYVLSHPEYYEYLKKLDIEIIAKYIPLSDGNDTNIYKVIKELFGEDAFDIYCTYGKYIENPIITPNRSEYLKELDISSKTAFLESIEKIIYKCIMDGNTKYDENLPQRFKERYPELFIREDLDPEFKKRFYNRQLTIEDFNNQKLFEDIGNVSISFGFPTQYSWIGKLFTDYEDQVEANKIRLNIIATYMEALNATVKISEIVKSYILNNIDGIDYQRSVRLREHLTNIVNKIRNSNSIEISNFGDSVLNTILKFDNPEEKLDEIEKVFLKNNLPMFAKVFTCFRLLYPDFTKENKFDFAEDSRLAPQLIKPNIRGFGVINDDVEKRFQILFNDLFRISVNSNTYILKSYIQNLKSGNEICLKLIDGSIKFDDLSDEQKQILNDFISKLEVIYEVSNNNHKNISNLSLEDKYNFFIREYRPTYRYSLVDRIVRSYGFYLGIESLEDLERKIDKNIIEANIRNKRAPEKLVLEKGDFIRSIGNLDSVGGSLRYGNVCKELLGTFTGYSDTDTTPLDVDWTYIENTDSLISAIDGTPTGWGFGNVFIYMKHNNRHLNITRTAEGDVPDSKYDADKAEMFCSATSRGGYETHWGVRTGIATTDIDAIIFKEDRTFNSRKPYNDDGSVNYEGVAKCNELPAIKYEIAKNGVYIPIYNLSGDLIFTPKEFDSIRSKMNGLSYYGFNHYDTDRKTLEFSGIDDIIASINNDNNIVKERTIIKTTIEEVIKSKINVTKFNSKLTGDLSEGVVELIETGSTSRRSNVPGDSDFDFMLKIDRKDIIKTEELIRLFTEIFKPERIVPGRNNRFRGEGITLPGIDRKVDIDISIDQKRNKYDYSSEMALNERYDAIRRDSEDDYQLVLANIIKAKKILKEAGCYKSSKSDSSQGGLSGLGVENWILQNGGSLYLAAKDFLKHVYKNENEKRSFDEFKEVYTIWDFGANHEPRERNSPRGMIVRYPYDEFVSDNMNENGYNKMIEVLEKFVMEYDKSKIGRFSK